MAQTKNTFIKSRMNKDLDERLVPNGEYRDGFNIEVSQSEDADVGTVSTALGNVKLTDFGLTADCDARIIGYFADEKDKDIYIFITNFVDTSNDKLSSFPSEEAICQIWKRNIDTNLNTKLVEGKFLNLSLTHEVLNVNLLEDLLFWTDNRSQPRKINVTKANPGNEANPTYYTNEDQISVAKYYPFAPIELLDNYIVDYSVSFAGGGTAGSPANYYSLSNLPGGPGDIVPTSTVTGGGVGLTVQITSADSITGNLQAVKVINKGEGYKYGDTVTIAPESGTAQITLIVETQSTMKDKCSEFLPETLILEPPYTTSFQSGAAFTAGQGQDFVNDTRYKFGIAKIENSSGQILGTEGARVTSTSFNPSTPKNFSMSLSWKGAPQTVTGVTKITIGVNPDYDANWPGDCDFLKDKFVRFAYRFKFDDNEYSLISPFTQACFIPKQNGYFLSETRGSETITDSELAYKSTDLEFFENSVNNIGLKIPSPQYLESVDNFFSNALEKMHIEEIDIIYKDDEENALKVVDTITRESFENLNSNYIIYDYQSRKPIRTLPSSEITRVSDTVPLKSLTQEVSGNRVIYGNYTDGHTSNATLNYEIAAAAKSILPEVIDAGIIDQDIKKEYQNHTLKQNRTYQVGIVLSDRYGRQSDVILSSLDNSKTITSGESYRGSTIFRPFYSAGPNLLNIPTLPALPTTWPGDSLKVQFNSQVPENTGQFGYPGLFLDYRPPSVNNLNGGLGYPSNGSGVLVTGGSGTGMTVNYVIEPNEGAILSVTIVNPGAGFLNNDIITIPGGTSGSDASFVFKSILFPNLTGWYSYKIVVKQQEHDYYNVYLPGIVNGAINEDGLISNTRATLSLYGDNINKVPKDLLDVGPSQTNYRSDTRLSLRVENTSTDSRRFYPGSNVENVVSLSELTDLGIDLTRVSEVVDTGAIPPAVITLGPYNNKIQRGMSVTAVSSTNALLINSSQGAYVSSYYSNPGSSFSSLIISGTTTTIPTDAVITFGPPGLIFNSGSNPIIGILSTSKSIGVAEENNFSTKLAVFETKPVNSSLDLFFETTSSGLISTLNQAILSGTTGQELPISISPISFNLDESLTGAQGCTNSFSANNIVNTAITAATTTCSILSVRDANNADRKSEFDVLPGANATFSLTTTNPAGEGYYVSSNNNDVRFRFAIEMTNQGVSVTKNFNGVIANKEPQYVLPLPPNVNSPGSVNNLPPYAVYKNIDSILPDRRFKPSSFPPGTYFGAPFPGFKALNGSGDAALNKKDLTWELVSCIPIDGEDEPFSASRLATTSDGQIITLAYNRAIWPTVIRPVGSVTTADPLKSYQIEIGREYVHENRIQLIPGSSVTNNNGDVANVSSSTTPSLSIVDDEALIYVHQLNGTVDGLTAEIRVEDNSFLNFITWNNTNNNYTTQVSINIEEVVRFVLWEIKLRVSDGGNLRANTDITVQIKQRFRDN